MVTANTLLMNFHLQQSCFNLPKIFCIVKLSDITIEIKFKIYRIKTLLFIALDYRHDFCSSFG